MIVFAVNLVVAVFLGIWAIILARKQLYPGRITFFQENCIALFDSIVKNLPELVVEYKGNPIKENLFLLKGIFINTGVKDISEAMVEKKLAIKLPKNYKWLTAKVIDTSDSLRANAKISGETNLTFNTGLFKRNEFIRFEALAEVPIKVNGRGSSKRLTNVLKFSHRIADTRKINKKGLPNPRSDAVGTILLTFFAFFIAFSLFMGFTHYGLPTKTNFIIQTENNEAIEVSVKLKMDGNLEIKGVDEAYKKVLPLSEFMNKEVSPKIIVDPGIKAIFIIFESIGLLCLFGAFMSCLAYMRNKKLNSIIVNLVGT